jgi:antitoxin YefM
MDAITYTHARSHLAETMEKVCDDHAPVIITRKNERSVVGISLEDYQALKATAYFPRSPKKCPLSPGVHCRTGRLTFLPLDLMTSELQSKEIFHA